jgi:putative salt-induced outer membrane protein YdiY
MLTRVLAALLLLGIATSAAADTLQLQNGDRVTGRVVRLDAGTLTFRTPHGDLTVPWTDVISLTSTETLRATFTTGADPRTITAIGPAGAGQITLTPGGPIALAQLAALGPLEPAIVITGGANAGLLRSSGNTDVNSLRLDADAAIRQNANRYTVSAAVNQAEDAGNETADNWTTSLNYDRFLTTRLFLNANGIFTNDRFRDLDLRSALGAGVGYQVLDTPLVTLTANGGLGWVNERFIVAPGDDYAAARESAALDLFIVPGRVQFFHKHDGYFGLEGEDNLFIKMQNGVRLSVLANFVTTLQLDLDYDKSPSPGRQQTDRTFALTFGYRF